MTDNEAIWNPRYVVYAQYHGHGPLEQLEIDKEKYPSGGHMMDFILFVLAKRIDFDRSDAFDKYLLDCAKEQVNDRLG